MKKIILISISLILLASLIVLPKNSAKADTANTGGSGGTIEMINSTDIEMLQEKVSIDVYSGTKYLEGYGEQGNYNSGYVTVDVSYTFQNTTSESVNTQMSFPEWCMGNCYTQKASENDTGQGNIGYKLAEFKAFENGKELQTVFNQDPILKTEPYSSNVKSWYTFSTQFAPQEKKEIRNTYWVIPTYYNGAFLNYILVTGSSWKNNIGKADVYVNFHDDLTIYEIMSISPKGYLYNKKDNSIEWHFTNIKPTKDDNIMIRYSGVDFPSKGVGSCNFAQDHGKSSTFLPDEKKNEDGYERTLNYEACEAHDNSASTAWVEGAVGDGIDEWVDVPLDNTKIVYEKVRIFTGYGASADLWKKNNRAKKLILGFPDKAIQTINLEDKFGYQVFDLDKTHVSSGNGEIVRVQIADIYKGTQYDDTAISEIQFLGLPSDAKFVIENDQNDVNKIPVQPEVKKGVVEQKDWKNFWVKNWYYMVGAVALIIVLIVVIVVILKKRKSIIKK